MFIAEEFDFDKKENPVDKRFFNEILRKNATFKKLLEKGIGKDLEEYQAKLNAHIKEIEENIKILSTNKFEHQNQIKALNKRLEEAIEIDKNFQKQIQEKQEKIEKTKREEEKKREKELKLSSEKKIVETKLTNLEKEKHDKLREKKKLEILKEVEQKKIKDTELFLKENLIRNEKEIEKEISKLDIELKKIEKELEKREKLLIQFQQKELMEKTKLENLRREEINLKNTIFGLESDIEFDASKIKQFQNEKLKVEDRIKQLNAHILSLQSQINALGQRKASIQDYTQTYKSGCSKKTCHVSRQGERDAVQSQIDELIRQEDNYRQDIIRGESNVIEYQNKIDNYQYNMKEHSKQLNSSKNELKFTMEQQIEYRDLLSISMGKIQKYEEEIIEFEGKIEGNQHQKLLLLLA